MAIRRQAVEKSPEVVDASATVEASAPAGPVAVPDAPQTAQDASGATLESSGTGRKGHTGPRLSWGLVINGLPLMRHLVDIGRQTSKDKGGYATLADLLESVKSSPIFTDHDSDGKPTAATGGVSLSELVNLLNLRNEWTSLRDKFVVQFSTKPTDQGGLGMEIPSADKKETEKKWIGRCKKLFTTGQWAQMEDAIARPKPQGLDFPKLVAGHRGRRSQGLNIEDI